MPCKKLAVDLGFSISFTSFLLLDSIKITFNPNLKHPTKPGFYVCTSGKRQLLKILANSYVSMHCYKIEKHDRL